MNVFVFKSWVQAKFARDDGASLVEYIFLVALIALMVMAAVIFMREEVVGGFHKAGSKVSSAPNP